MTSRICTACDTEKPVNRYLYESARYRHATDVCLDCLNAMDRAKEKPPVPGCPRCKRPLAQFHDSWCPIGNGEALPPEAEDEKPAPLVVRYVSPTMTADEVRPDRTRSGPVSLADIPTAELQERGRRGAASRMRNQAEHKEAAPVTTATKTYPLSVLDDLVEPKATPNETAVCTVCGPQPRIAFATKLNGDPWAVCKACRSAQASEISAKRKGIRRNKPIPQEVADVAYAPMTQAPDPEDMIPTKPVARFLPEPAVIDQAAPALAPAEPFEEIEQLPPIEDEIARAEQQLDDLRRIRDLMGDSVDDLTRLHRLVGEAIARKQVTA